MAERGPKDSSAIRQPARMIAPVGAKDEFPAFVWPITRSHPYYSYAK
jgi:hypothetical protein